MSEPEYECVMETPPVTNLESYTTTVEVEIPPGMSPHILGWSRRPSPGCTDQEWARRVCKEWEEPDERHSTGRSSEVRRFYGRIGDEGRAMRAQFIERDHFRAHGRPEGPPQITTVPMTESPDTLVQTAEQIEPQYREEFRQLMTRASQRVAACHTVAPYHTEQTAGGRLPALNMDALFAQIARMMEEGRANP